MFIIWIIFIIISTARIAEYGIFIRIEFWSVAQIEIIEIDIVSFEIVRQAPEIMRLLIVRLTTTICTAIRCPSIFIYGIRNKWTRLSR